MKKTLKLALKEIDGSRVIVECRFGGSLIRKGDTATRAA
jgi:hypothetical protein